MAKKKLLSESVVRRFMGLAGMETSVVSNTLKEMYSAQLDEENVEEAMYAEEEPAADEEMPPAEEPVADEEPAMDAEPEASGEVELTTQDVEQLRALADAAEAAGEIVSKLEGAAGAEAPAEEPEPELDAGAELDAEEPAPEGAPDDEEQEVMEALSGINLELNEDELVQEVAKRVAKRLVRAKKAQAQLDEALGRKRK